MCTARTMPHAVRGSVERQPAVRSNRTNYGDVLACACLFVAVRRAGRPGRRRREARQHSARLPLSAGTTRGSTHDNVRRHRARPQGQVSARPPTAGRGKAALGPAPPRLSLAAPLLRCSPARRSGRVLPRRLIAPRTARARRRPAPTEVKHPQQQTRRDARGGALTALAEPIRHSRLALQLRVASLLLHRSPLVGSISSRKHTRESGGVRYT